MGELFEGTDGIRGVERELGYYQGLADCRFDEIERLTAMLTRITMPLDGTRGENPGGVPPEFWSRKYEQLARGYDAVAKTNEELRDELDESERKATDAQRELESANKENFILAKKAEMLEEELKKLRDNLEFAVLCLPGGGGATDGAWHVDGNLKDNFVAVYDMDGETNGTRLLWSSRIEKGHKARIVVASDCCEAYRKFDRGLKGADNGGK